MMESLLAAAAIFVVVLAPTLLIGRVQGKETTTVRRRLGQQADPPEKQSQRIERINLLKEITSRSPILARLLPRFRTGRAAADELTRAHTTLTLPNTS